ncbi:MAG TPA: magnesium protoporphyrin IX methyltransferase [Paracoccaceae bacterium]|nr:magnesium protoporphyrin IX methyltransferase [Paracoccaceae bacterium]
MNATYDRTRVRLEEYFDRTAAQTWAKLTSDAPVSRIRATVRAGRDRMRGVLLGMLPEDLTGLRLLDAGCGVGQLAVEAARRGAEVVAIDISPTLVGIARDRAAGAVDPAVAARIDWRTGDMTDPALGAFDHVVAMDSLIHYRPDDIASALARLAPRVRGSVAFTVAPATPALSAMWAAGKLFPRSDRSPAIQPVAAATLARRAEAQPALAGWSLRSHERVASGFYISEALEARPPQPLA